MLPLGPQAPMDGGSWNPGLWLVNAATGMHTNIDIHVPSAALVDAAPSPDGTRIIYSTSLGLGLGSDVWLMNSDGNAQTHLFSSASTDGARTIIGLFAWSPDGTQIAYERLADSSTPFLPASLWVMKSNGSQSRYLAETDGGHGYLPVWSPDSTKLAYVVRTNIGSRSADMLAQSLQCAIGVIDVRGGEIWFAASSQQTHMQWNINPVWSANSSSIIFIALNPINARLGGAPRYWQASITRAQSNALVMPISPVILHVIAVS
jgi:Tol biopolymer transport system component